MISVRIDPALEGLGWTAFFHQQLLSLVADKPSFAEHLPARVVSDLGSEYVLTGSAGPRRAVLAGRLMAQQAAARPCVGDFVLAEAVPSGELLRIHHVFERSSVFRRKAAGPGSEGQSIAANVDLAVVVSAFSAAGAGEHASARGMNVRRLERYVRAIRDAPAEPVLVVNKADLCLDAVARAAEIAAQLGDSEVIPISAVSGEGMQRLRARVGPGTTAVFVGSSGVGKSSLINAWLGRSAQRVQAAREDDLRGRHTTTHRELFVLPSGGVLIDTPGMREFGLFADDATDEHATGFEDIDAIAEQCRFRDCEHETEPGCAVRAAVERGEIARDRLEHARKLVRELSVQRARHDGLMRHAARQQNRVRTRAVRARMKEKGRGE